MKAVTPSVSTYTKTLQSIKKNQVQRMRLTPGQNKILFEKTDGTIQESTVVLSDSFLQEAVEHDVDIFIAPEPLNIGSIIPNLIFFTIISSIIFQTIRGSSGRGGPMGPNILGDGFEFVEQTNVTFEDVAGIDDAKIELQEIIGFLKTPERYKDAGAKIPRGCLLYGEPGTGKTLCAKALAGEANVPFISVSASQFVELFVGLGASRIRSLFKKARERGPCIIFIDEIDAVGKQRSSGAVSGGGNDEREQTLNQLLLEMDGFKSNDNIIVVAATNRLDNLDKALLRPGRFDRKIKVDLPDSEGRRQILGVHSQNKKGNWDELLPDLAKKTIGFSGADLENIMNESAINAARDSRDTVLSQDINEAFEKVTLGLRKNGRYRSKETLRKVAYHEAGHALAGIYTNNPPSKVTIVQRGNTGGVTVFTPPEDDTLPCYNDLFNRMVIGLGGTVAEEVVFGKDNVTTGATSDLKLVTDIAYSMVTKFGFSDLGKMQFSEDNDEVRREVRTLVDEAYKRTKVIITARRSDLDVLAEKLLEEETVQFGKVGLSQEYDSEAESP